MTKIERRHLALQNVGRDGPACYSRRQVLHMLWTVPAWTAGLGPALARAAGETSTFRSAPLPLADSPDADSASVSLGVLKIRHSAFLIDFPQVRIGVDLCLAQNLNFAPFFWAPPVALPPDAIGALDLLLFSSARGDHFDALALKRQPNRHARCLVPDASLAKRLRNVGFRNVQIVHAGQQLTHRELHVTVSPSADLWGNGDAVGFHLRHGARSIWHMGAPPPLDLFASTVDFAQQHPAEVVLACADGQAVWGRPLGMALDDALLLATLARARIVIPQHDDATASVLGQLFFRRPPRRAVTLPHSARLVSMEPNIWYRIAAMN